MTKYHPSEDARFSVLLAVRSLGICDEVSIPGALCDRISGSITAYLAEVCDRPDVSDWVGQLGSLTQLLLSGAPSIGRPDTRREITCSAYPPD